MDLFYYPELENPPMDKECKIAFSFIGTNGSTECVEIEPGLNREIPDERWAQIKERDYAKTLLANGALRLAEASEAAAVVEEAALTEQPPSALSDLSPADAIKAVARSKNLRTLEQWLAAERRVPVRTALTRQITELKG